MFDALAPCCAIAEPVKAARVKSASSLINDPLLEVT
jgi:hypothetical protein